MLGALECRPPYPERDIPPTLSPEDGDEGGAPTNVSLSNQTAPHKQRKVEWGTVRSITLHVFGSAAE
jgi:hypothetical protein